MSSATSSVSIDKLVSKDLSLLAPNVESFLSNLKVTMAQMDQVLLDQKNTSYSEQESLERIRIYTHTHIYILSIYLHIYIYIYMLCMMKRYQMGHFHFHDYFRDCKYVLYVTT